ncbi:MAG: DUF748 domain-containing protein [Thermodesulfobacteriota bacterium]
MEQPAKQPSRLYKVLKRVLLPAVIAFAAYSLLGFFALPPLLRHYLVKGISEHTHRQASVGKIAFNPYNLTLSVNGFSLGDRGNSDPFLSLDHLFLNLHGSSFLRLGLVVEELRMERPRLRVVHRKDGTFNFSDLAADKAGASREGSMPFGVSIRSLGVSGGTVDFKDEQKGLSHQIKGINLDLPFLSVFPEDTNTPVESRFAAAINGGAFRLWGQARPLQERPDSRINFVAEGIDLTRYVDYLPFEKKWKLAAGRADLRGSLSYDVLNGSKGRLLSKGELSLAGLDIKDPAGKPLLRIPSLTLDLGSSEPLSNSIHIRRVHVDSPEIHAARKSDGTLDLAGFIPMGSAGRSSGEGAAERHPRIRVDMLRVKGGKVRFTDEAAGRPFETVLSKLNLAVTNFGNERANKAPFDLSFETEAGEQGGVKGSLCLAPFSIDGVTSLRGVPIQKYRPYFEALLPLDLEGGVLDVSTAFVYSAADGETPERCSLSGVTLSLTDVGFKRKGEPDSFLSVPSLAVAETLVDLLARRLTVGRLNTDLGFRRKGETEAFLTVPNLALEEASVDLPAKKLTVGSLLANKGKVVLSRSPEGAFDMAAPMFSWETKAGQGQEASDDGRQDTGWEVSVRKAQFDGYTIRFRDYTPARGPVDLTLEPVRLTAEDLSNAKGAELKIAAEVGLASKGSLSAGGTVVVDPLEAKLDLAIKDVDLLALQPYWADRIKLALRRGTVSAAGHLDLQYLANEGTKAQFRGETSVSGLSVVDTRNGESFLRCKSLFLGGMDLSHNPGVVSIDQVAVTDFFSCISIDSKGVVNLQGLVEKQDPVAREPAGDRERRPEGAFGDLPFPQILVKTITLQGGRISFSDGYIKPRVSAELSEVGGRISGLSSDEETLAEVRLSGRLDNHAPLNITGKMNPFKRDTYIDLAAQFKNIDLSPMSPYAGKYIGYTIEKGKLSLELKYLLLEKNLESQNRIFLDQFTLGETVESPQATKLPVALAVSLLKNRNGEIQLHLPVKGNLDDPQFNLGEVILKMLGNLLEKALTSPFSLLASVFGVGEELRFLEFPPGVAKVTSEAEGHLSKLTQIMYERPALRLEIEGHADPKAEEEALRDLRFIDKLKAWKLREMMSRGARWMPLDQIQLGAEEEYQRVLAQVFQAEGFPKPRGEWGGLKPLPPEEMEKLIRNHIQLTEEDFRTLADKRAEAARDYILKSGRVEGERLFLVTPKSLVPEKKKDVKSSRVDFRLK